MVASCSAVGCTNHKKRNPELSFFKLPRDKTVAAEWLTKMRRVNLPKQIYLCEVHFNADCFDYSVDLKNQLLPGMSQFS